MKILAIFFFLIYSIMITAQQREHKNDWKVFYTGYNVSGSLIIYDQTRNEYLVYNEDRCEQPFSPASTFKILNSLIALETGVIKDENEVIPWDSVKRAYDKWNMDQTLRR